MTEYSTHLLDLCLQHGRRDLMQYPEPKRSAEAVFVSIGPVAEMAVVPGTCSPKLFYFALAILKIYP